MTPPHYAVGKNHKAVMHLLLGRGADQNLANKDGERPLHGAVWHGHKDVVLLFLDRGADSNIVSPNRGDEKHEKAQHS